MNKVILMGRLTADPELRQTQSGIASCRFTVAVRRDYKNQKNEYESDFISCVAWRGQAEFIQKYFKKGSPISLVGNRRTGSYQDRKYSDVTHYTSDLYVENVEFCLSDKNNVDKPKQESTVKTNNQNETYGNLAELEEILSDGDVPF